MAKRIEEPLFFAKRIRAISAQGLGRRSPPNRASECIAAAVAASSIAAAGKRRVRASVHSCTAAEHVALAVTSLREIFGPGYPAKFQAALEDPLYAPCDRLLLRRRGRIIAARPRYAPQHAVRPALAARGRAGRTGHRTKIAAAGPGNASLGGRRTADGAVRRAGRTVADAHPAFLPPHRLGLMRQQFPRRRQPASRSSPGFWNKDSASAARSRIQVRPWRRWEEEAIARVYRQNLARQFRPLGTDSQLLALAAGTAGLRSLLRGPGRPRSLGPQGSEHATSSAMRPSAARRSSN